MNEQMNSEQYELFMQLLVDKIGRLEKANEQLRRNSTQPTVFVDPRAEVFAKPKTKPKQKRDKKGRFKGKMKKKTKTKNNAIP